MFNNKMKTYLSVLMTITFWGITFASLKIALTESFPLMVITLRCLIACVPIGLLALYRGELKLPTGKQFIVLCFMAFLGFYFHLGIQTIAMRTAGSATSNLQMASSPTVAAVLAAVFLKEKVNFREVCGILTAFAGVAIVLLLGTKGAQGISCYNFGDFLITISVVGWAAFMVLTRRLLKDGEYTPMFTLFWETFFAGIMCLITVFAIKTPLLSVFNYSAKVWAAILFLALLSSFLAYVFWYDAAAKLDVRELMVFQFFQPVVGIIAGYFIIGERFTIWLFIGGIMIILGVCAVNINKGKTVKKKNE